MFRYYPGCLPQGPCGWCGRNINRKWVLSTYILIYKLAYGLWQSCVSVVLIQSLVGFELWSLSAFTVMGDSPEEKRERAAKVKGFELKRFERRFYLSEGETKAWSNMQNLSFPFWKLENQNRLWKDFGMCMLEKYRITAFHGSGCRSHRRLSFRTKNHMDPNGDLIHWFPLFRFPFGSKWFFVRKVKCLGYRHPVAFKALLSASVLDVHWERKNGGGQRERGKIQSGAGRSIMCLSYLHSYICQAEYTIFQIPGVISTWPTL